MTSRKSSRVTLADITEITIIKYGEDIVAIAEIALTVNGKEVLREHSGESASTYLWLGESGGHEGYFTIGYAELRTSPWLARIPRPAANRRRYRWIETEPQWPIC